MDIYIDGAGEKAFSAGFDLKEPIPAKFPPLITRGLEIWKPVIAQLMVWRWEAVLSLHWHVIFGLLLKMLLWGSRSTVGINAWLGWNSKVTWRRYKRQPQCVSQALPV